MKEIVSKKILIDYLPFRNEYVETENSK